MVMLSIEPRLDSTKREGRFVSRLRSKPDKRSTTISRIGVKRLVHVSFLDAVRQVITMIGLDASFYGTHSPRRTKATLIHKKTGNLRVVQLLLGHTKVESTVRYL